MPCGVFVLVPAGVLRLFHTMGRGMGDSFRRHEEINGTAGLDCSLQNQDIRTWIFSGTLAFAQSGENVIAASRSLNIMGPTQLSHWVGVRWGGGWGGWGGMITSMFLRAHWHGNLITRELAVGLCPFLSLWWSVLAAQPLESFKTDLASLLCWAVLLALALVVRFGRSAAQIGLRHLGLLGCPVSSPCGGPFRALGSPNPSKRTSPACYAWLCSLLPLVVRFGRSAAQILQNGPRQLRPSGGPFWPFSSPNPSKRTSPACYAGACSLPKSSKTDLASFVCLAVLLALALSGGPFWPLSSPNPSKRTYSALLVVRFGRSAARILQNGLRQLAFLGCAPCSHSGGPFWPLSSPNPPKRRCAQPGSNPESLG